MTFLDVYVVPPSPQCHAMQKTWFPVQISQTESLQISDTLLVVSIRFFITYDLRRAAMAVWVDGHFDTLFQKQRERS